MEYIHVRNLEKYHLDYKDRKLSWCKAYFKMLNADPEFELLEEIDKWRFIAFIMLELQLQHEVPVNPEYLQRKGFDLKKRPIYLTIQMLHSFISVVTKPLHNRNVDKEEYKEEEYKEDSVTQKVCNTPKQLSDDQFITTLKANNAYKHVDIDCELGKMDAWLSTRPHRKKTRRFIVNWLNKVEKPVETKSNTTKSKLDELLERDK